MPCKAVGNLKIRERGGVMFVSLLDWDSWPYICWVTNANWLVSFALWRISMHRIFLDVQKRDDAKQGHWNWDGLGKPSQLKNPWITTIKSPLPPRFSKLPTVLPRRGWDSRFLNASRSEDLRVKIKVSYWNETNMTLVNVCLFVCLLGVITMNIEIQTHVILW